MQEEEKNERGDPQGGQNKLADFINDILGIHGPDVGHSRYMYIETGLRLEVCHERIQVIEDKVLSNRSVYEVFVQIYHGPKGFGLFVAGFLRRGRNLPRETLPVSCSECSTR